jgi:hypothetical protein
MRHLIGVVVVWGIGACGGSGTHARDGSPGGDGAHGADGAAHVDAPPIPPVPDANPACGSPATPAGANVVIAPEFAPYYSAYDLGVVPGVPDPLGGASVKYGDNGTLLIAGNSENSGGTIYQIGVTRETCGHIVGFNGTASVAAVTPFVDANLVYAPSTGGLMFYTRWPENGVSELPFGAMASARDIDLTTIAGFNATGDEGPGGIGFVPPGYGAAGELRIVTWPAGRWYHLDLAPDGSLFTVSAATQVATLGGNPGGFAYVPAGSPGFTNPSVIVAEWSQTDPTMDRVAVYEADTNGDPMIATRKEFMSKFPRPWGAYFEPLTGDYLFLSWGTGSDHLYIVQGFKPPPIIP